MVLSGRSHLNVVVQIDFIYTIQSEYICVLDNICLKAELYM